MTISIAFIGGLQSRAFAQAGRPTAPLPPDCAALISGQTIKGTDLTARHLQCAVLKQTTQAGDRYGDLLKGFSGVNPAEITFDAATQTIGWTCTAMGVLDDAQRLAAKAGLQALIGDAIQAVTLLNSEDSSKLKFELTVNDGSGGGGGGGGDPIARTSCVCTRRCRVGLLGLIRAIVFRNRCRSYRPCCPTLGCGSGTVIAANAVTSDALATEAVEATESVFLLASWGRSFKDSDGIGHDMNPTLRVLDPEKELQAPYLPKLGSSGPFLRSANDSGAGWSPVRRTTESRMEEDSSVSGVASMPQHDRLPSSALRLDVSIKVIPAAATPRSSKYDAMSPIERRTAAEIAFGVGCAAYWRGQYREALAQLDECTTADPETARYWYFKGLAQKHLGFENEFATSIRRGAELVRENSSARSDVYRGLERVQGSLRAEVERINKEVRLAAN